MPADILNIEANERIDLSDFQFATDGAVQANARQIFAEMLTDPAKTSRAFILDGFEVTNPAGNQISVARGRALLSAREGSTVYQGYLTALGDATKIVDLSGSSDGTYGVYLRFEYVDGDNESRIFWSPVGNGSEFAQTVSTRRQANWSMRTELTSPGAEWLSIAAVVVSGGSVTGVTDQRPLYFEGVVSDTYASEWSTDGGGVANDRNADRQQYGVKDLQTFTAAMRQCVEDIKGRGLRRWWERDIGGLNVGFDANPVEWRMAVGDANFYMDHDTPGAASAPLVQFDSGDWLEYDRSGDIFKFNISSVEEMTLNATIGLSVAEGLRTGGASSDPGAGGGIFPSGLVVGFDGVPVADQLHVFDANFGFEGSTTPLLQFDANDYFQYNRSSNYFDFVVNSVVEARISADGLRVTDGLTVGSLGLTPVADQVQVGDVHFHLSAPAGVDPKVSFDDGDYLQYDESENVFNFDIASTNISRIQAEGLFEWESSAWRPARPQVDKLPYNSSTITPSTTPTSIGAITIPAAKLAAGAVIRFAAGVECDPLASNKLIISCYINGVSWGAVIETTADTGLRFARATGELVVESIGASASVRGTLELASGINGTVFGGDVDFLGSGLTTDTTGSVIVDIRAAWQSADASGTVRRLSVHVDVQ